MGKKQMDYTFIPTSLFHDYSLIKGILLTYLHTYLHLYTYLHTQLLFTLKSQGSYLTLANILERSKIKMLTKKKPCGKKNIYIHIYICIYDL